MGGIYDNYEEAISTCQELSFETLGEKFTKSKLEFDETQKPDLGLINSDGNKSRALAVGAVLSQYKSRKIREDYTACRSPIRIRRLCIKAV